MPCEYAGIDLELSKRGEGAKICSVSMKQGGCLPEAIELSIL